MPRDSDKEDELDLLSVINPQKAAADDYPLKVLHHRNKYKEEEFCQGLMEFMAYGHTFGGACGRLGIVLSTARTYLKKYPKFAEAKELGEQLRLYRLERVLNYSATGEAHPADEENWTNIIKDRRLNFNAIIFSLKTVHRDQYSEKVITEDVSASSDIEKPQEVLNDEIAKQLDTLRRSIDEGPDGEPEKGRINITGKT